MKYLPLIVILLVSSGVAAQKRFEGVIHYLMVSADSNLQAGITAWYKKDKIKFTTELKKGPAGGDVKNETIIINFKKAAIDRFKDPEKKVERERLRGKNNKQEIPSLTASGIIQTIVGYPCTEYTTGHFFQNGEKR